MGLAVDGSLEFASLPADPNAPQDGGVLLYVEDGTLKAVDTPVPGPGGSSSGGVPGAVWYDTKRPPLVFLDTVATAAQVPSAVDLGITNFVIGDMVVRQADYELFEYEQTGQFSKGLVDTGTKWAGQIANGIPIGGAAGQILSKKSATNYDTQWINPPSGGAASGVLSANTAARTTRSAAYSTVGTTYAKVPFDTVGANQDPGNHMVNGRYTATTSGWYQVNGCMSVVGNAAGQRNIINIYKNGAIWSEGGEADESGGVEGLDPVVADLVYLAAGDYIELWYYCTTAGLSMQTGTASYFSVVQVDQAFGAGAANTAAKLYRNAAYTLGTAGWTTFPLDSVQYDAGGHASTDHSKYVCPNTGYYQVNGEIFANSLAAGEMFSVGVFINGALASGGEATQSDVGAMSWSNGVGDIVKCNAGDTITIGYYSTAALNIAAGPTNSYMSVVQVDLGGSSSGGSTTVSGVSNVASMNTGARAYKNTAGQVLAASAFVKITLDKVDAGNDPGNHVDAATNHRYNVTSEGWYQVNGCVTVGSTAAGQEITACLFHNGAFNSSGDQAASVASGQSFPSTVSDLIYCVPGDYIELDAFCTAALTVSTGASSTYMSVVQVDKALAPTSGAVSAGTAARAYRSAALTSVAASYNKIPLDTTSFDPGGHINTTSGRYVVPATGYYQVNGEVAWGPTTASVDVLVHADIYVNGALAVVGSVVPRADNAGFMRPNVSDVIHLNAGDYVELYSYTSGAFPLLLNGSLYNYLSVVQVDQPVSNVVVPTTAARGYRTAAFNMPAGAWTKIPVDTIAADPGGHFSLTNSRYTVPMTGYYSVSISVAFTPTATDLVAAACYKNGVAAFKSLVAEAAPTAGVAGASASDIVFCNAGDVLELWGLSTAAAGLSIENTVNFISIVQVDQPIGGAGGNAVTPTTGARMYRNAAFTPAANTWTKVPLDTVGHDSGGHTDIANSRYICPNPGWYQVNANASLNVGTAQTNTTGYVSIAQNGVRVASNGARGSDNFNEMICQVSDLLWCAAGDVLELQVFSSAGSPLFLGSNGNYLSVVQVDAPTPAASNTGGKAYGDTTDFTGSISATTWTKIHLNHAVTDPGGHFDLTTNFCYKVTAAGWYQVVGNVAASIATAGVQSLIAAIFKNGTFVCEGSDVPASQAVGATTVSQVMDLVYCNPGDTIDLRAICPGTTGGMALVTANASGNNYLSVVKVDQPQYANNPTPVTALPATPYDGQEIYFVADAANGVKWHLRYNAGSSSQYKWEYLGGPPVRADVVTNQSLPGAQSTWEDLATVGPEITLPVGGDYQVEYGGLPTAVPTTGWLWYLGVSAGGANPTRVTASTGAASASNAASFGANVSDKARLTGLAGGAVLKLMYYWVGVNPSWQNRWLEIVPVRVG